MISWGKKSQGAQLVLQQRKNNTTFLPQCVELLNTTKYYILIAGAESYISSRHDVYSPVRSGPVGERLITAWGNWGEMEVTVPPTELELKLLGQMDGLAIDNEL